ncbi:MAG: hypothetical protein LBL62_00425, partial [Planctomycetaceae bacterium]|nr:hypothetical protein [Planctomycetaceae bacterium]
MLKELTKQELQDRADLYDLDFLTPFSTPEVYEVSSDDPFPLDSFITRALLREGLIKNEQNRQNTCVNEVRIDASILPDLAPADNMGGVKYQKIYGGYDGGVEAGFEGFWGKTS